MKRNLWCSVFLIVLFSSCTKTRVNLERNDADKSVDIFMGEDHFTSYFYADHLMKPSLWPVITSKGTEVTRKYPMKKVAGERTDHPHHVGMWMNYGDVNGIDYWGHSEATPEDQEYRYGIIRHQEIVELVSDKREGALKVKTQWSGGGITQIMEDIEFHFIDRGNIRIIDWISTLTAMEDIVFNDTKEGMFAIRVSRELELPAEGTVTLLDDHGNPVTVEADQSNVVSGDYLSSEGKTGLDVWGTRAEWVKLYGNYEDEKVAIVIIDHNENPGHPTYWHARGYGLFAANPLGQKVFSEDKEELNLSLKKGESARFAFRTLICSGEIVNDEINRLMGEFNRNY